MGTVSPTTEPLSTKMGVFFLLFILVPTSLASQNCTSIQDFLNSTDISECNSTTLRAFLSFFNIEDDGKMVEHTEALCVHLNTIKEQNENYVEGKSTWYSCVYDFDSLTPEEFQKQKTGAITSEDDAVDDRSEQFFDKYRYSRASVPASYSSVDRGYVSPVRNQWQCGSCVAFATMATVETCYKKLTGVFGDYSEQQFVDCGYKQNGADGCDGAPFYAYAKWAGDRNDGLAHESSYSYLNT